MHISPCGIIPPLVTPFDRNGLLHETAFRRVINYVLDAGVHGVFVAGSQGEFYALDYAERVRLFEIAVEEVNGRVPVYAGTAAVTTAETIRLTKAAEVAGVDAVSIISPYFIVPSGDELYEHYLAVANATRLPVLLYNNPDRTAVNIPVKTILRLVEIDNIIGMKDSSGDATIAGEIIRQTGPGFSFLCGRDTFIYASLTLGGRGAVSASANVAPKLVLEIYEEYERGNMQKAREAQYRLAPLRMAFSLGSFPVVIKEAFEIMGFDVGTTRAPIRPLVPEKRADLTGILREMGLVD